MPQQYVVPQFIDVEDKIIGPITIRQFIIMIIGGLFLFVCYKIFVLPIFIAFAIGILATVALFGFVKVNGRPFHVFIVGMLQTLKRPSKRIWNKGMTVVHAVASHQDKKTSHMVAPQVVKKSQVTHSRLSELSLMADTGGRYKTDLHAEITQGRKA
ncbi:MAG: hypothetical protein UV70_C0004G0043 [Parcubacteria group bacterium GW2011_GWA2_43_13]|nr:MAG: hypothetical protein UV70_C0004G0043 [Parcubacteria group bacterium GW2011_GWA2_43_13]HAZ16479.1 hypothetical protein [Candidatus Jacksonbacteria bacterium]